jgi:deoxyribodipyrimidine photolyase
MVRPVQLSHQQSSAFATSCASGSRRSSAQATPTPASPPPPPPLLQHGSTTTTTTAHLHRTRVAGPKSARRPARSPASIPHASPLRLASPGVSPVAAPGTAASSAPCPAPADAQPTSAPLPRAPAVAWLQDVLRVHDNPALHAAVAWGAPLVPVVVIDVDGNSDGATRSPRVAQPKATQASSIQQPRQDARAVADLRTSLRDRGSDLVVLPQKTSSSAGTAAALLDLCRQVRADRVYAHVATTDRQRIAQSHLSRLCDANGVALILCWTGTLVDPAQLPFAVGDMPDNCDDFGQALLQVGITRPLPPPDVIPGVPNTLRDEWVRVPNCDESELCKHGEQQHGESAALWAMESFMAGHSLVGRDPECKSRAVVADSTGLGNGRITTVLDSMQCYLDKGYLSPRRLYHEIATRFESHAPRRFCAELTMYLREYRFYASLKAGYPTGLLQC